MYGLKKLSLAFVVYLYLMPVAAAIPPPDLIISTLQSALQFLGVAAAFVVGAYFTLKDQLRLWYAAHKFWFWWSGGMLLIILAGGLAWWSHQSIMAEKQLWKTEARTEMQDLINQAVDTAALEQQFETRYLSVSESVKEIPAAQALPDREAGISWERFLADFYQHPDTILLDVREPLSYQYGHLPGTINVRLADFVRGGWEELNLPKTGKNIVVLCYVSTSGALVSNFLRQLGYDSTYFLDQGMDGLTEEERSKYFDGFLFYPKRDYDLLALEKTAINPSWQGIDVRSPAVFDQKALPGTTNFFWELRTMPEIQNFVWTLSYDVPLYGVCDSVLTCYSANIMQMHLQRRGFDYKGTVDLTPKE